jgi:hypothetical protein
MTVEQLQALAGGLAVALTVSEALPFMKRVKGNGWVDLGVTVLRAIGSQKRRG